MSCLNASYMYWYVLVTLSMNMYVYCVDSKI